MSTLNISLTSSAHQYHRIYQSFDSLNLMSIMQCRGIKNITCGPKPATQVICFGREEGYGKNCKEGRQKC